MAEKSAATSPRARFLAAPLDGGSHFLAGPVEAECQPSGGGRGQRFFLGDDADTFPNAAVGDLGLRISFQCASRDHSRVDHKPGDMADYPLLAIPLGRMDPRRRAGTGEIHGKYAVHVGECSVALDAGMSDLWSDRRAVELCDGDVSVAHVGRALVAQPCPPGR